jgi:hypothetical protein
MMRLPAFASLRTVVLGAVLCAALLESGTAEAGRVRFGGSAHVSGSVRFRGGATSVRFARPWFRPRVWVGGSIWVGSYYWPRPYYYYYYPESVPSYYGQSYYPVAPSQTFAQPPGVMAPQPAPRPSLPTFGIGAAAGGTKVQDRSDSSDLSVLARLRLTPGLLIEGEFGKTTFADNIRVDRRIGGSLVWELGAYNSWAPYLLGGGGVQQAEVDGSFTTTQQFFEAGIGLRWALSRNLHIMADVRAGTRKTVDSNQPSDVPSVLRSVSPPLSPDSENENFTRGRLAAMLYF